MGTLMCHYQHHAHTDPFLYPGLQDISAHVNFTALADAALSAQLDCLGYTHQAAFLLGCCDGALGLYRGVLSVCLSCLEITADRSVERSQAPPQYCHHGG